MNRRAVKAVLVGSRLCFAEGYSVTSEVPALAMCAYLVAAGYHPDRSLVVFRDGELAMRIRSIGFGAAYAPGARQDQAASPPGVSEAAPA